MIGVNRRKKMKNLFLNSLLITIAGFFVINCGYDCEYTSKDGVCIDFASRTNKPSEAQIESALDFYKYTMPRYNVSTAKVEKAYKRIFINFEPEMIDYCTGTAMGLATIRGLFVDLRVVWNEEYIVGMAHTALFHELHHAIDGLIRNRWDVDHKDVEWWKSAAIMELQYAEIEGSN